MLVELQHFDLAGDVIRDVDYLDAIDPLLMLWEAHDLEEIRTNGLLFRMPVGADGDLLVSALDHQSPGNQAGVFLLGQLLKGLAEGRMANSAVVDSRGAKNLERLRAEVSGRRISLESREWRFQPDPQEAGREGNWSAASFDDSTWETIRADRHWESQGHETLDGWAWYRLKLDVPEDWPAGKAFLTFTGVDDYYDLYVNGVRVGSAGNIERRETAFELRSSFDVSKLIEPGKPLTIAVAVFDWYGAGGIFRPVELSTQSVDAGRRWLK
jgi:hypothetical protein